MAFDILSMAIDRDKERYVKRCEANRENGRKGGRPKKNQTDIEETEKTERLDLKPKKPIRIWIRRGIRIWIRRGIVILIISK